MIGRAWTAWVRRATRPVDVRPYALVRVLLSLVVLWDLLLLARHDLVHTLFTRFADGGLSAFKGVDFVLGGFGPDVGVYLYATVVVCMAMVALGIGSRPASIIGVLAYAQLGALYPPGDRGIDRVMRTVLLLLAFTQAHRRYSLPTALGWRPRAESTCGWIRDTFHVFLTIVYLAAGFTKIGSGGWFTMMDPPQLFRVMADPTAGHLDPDSPVGRALWPVFRLAGAIAVVNELVAPLLLTRWAPYWAVFGALMHLGIAFGMKLGAFSWGMLALYPVLFAPWLLPVLDRLESRFSRAASPVSSAPPPGSSPR